MPAPKTSLRPKARPSRGTTVKVGGLSITGKHERGSSPSRAQDRDRTESSASKPTRTRTNAKPAAAEPVKPVARGAVEADTSVLTKAIAARRNAGSDDSYRGAVGFYQRLWPHGKAKTAQRALKAAADDDGPLTLGR